MTLPRITLRTTSLIVALCAVGACATQGVTAQQRAPAVRPSLEGAPDRDEFEAELATRQRRGSARSDKDPYGSLKIHIGDDSVVQYWLVIENPGSQVFTAAQLRRASERVSDPGVAVFFANAQAQDRRVQMRGTLSLLRTRDLESFIRAVRARPGDFVVSVRGAGGREVMTGQLQ
jgi:hypothetical protein